MSTHGYPYVKIPTKVWDKLQVTHERTNRVKETKVGMLTYEYELFSMKSKELIFEMYN